MAVWLSPLYHILSDVMCWLELLLLWSMFALWSVFKTCMLTVYIMTLSTIDGCVLELFYKFLWTQVAMVIPELPTMETYLFNLTVFDCMSNYQKNKTLFFQTVVLGFRFYKTAAFISSMSLLTKRACFGSLSLLYFTFICLTYKHWLFRYLEILVATTFILC